MMMPEIWAAVAAALLAVAAVGSSLMLVSRRQSWDAIVLGARVTALGVLIVALVAAALQQGRWIADNPQQALLGIVVAMLAIQMLLAWRLGAGSAGPWVDIIALALSLVGAFVSGAGAPLSSCAQEAALLQAHWILLSLGGGSVLVAASAGLSLGLGAALAGRGKELQLLDRLLLHDLMAQAATLTLVGLGSGLVVGVWWAWRTSGTWLGANAREVWMAVAWLPTAMSVLAWQLAGHRGRWVALLALVAALAVVVGLLLPVNAMVAGI